MNLDLFFLHASMTKQNKQWRLMGDALWQYHARRRKTTVMPKRIESQFKLSKYSDYMIMSPLGRTDTSQTIVYIHGGGFVNEMSHSEWQFVSEMCKETKVSFAILSYPLLPGATIDEVYSAIHTQITDIRRRLPRSSLTLMGDFTGGQLALGYTQLDYCHNIHRVIAISPVCDALLTNPAIKSVSRVDPILAPLALPEIFRRLRGNHQLSESLLSPINGSYENLDVLVVSGTRDITNPDTVLMIKNHYPRLRYLEGRHLPHNYPLTAIPDAQNARKRIAQFIHSKNQSRQTIEV
jgi:acetyl esterase/lipase